METRENTKLLLKDIERNEGKIDTLEGINLSQLDDHLIVASSVVRDVMDVAELASEVERIALEHNLEPQSQSASNMNDMVVEASTLDTAWVPSYADAISGPFSFKGSFHDLTAFLEDLRNNSKTILSLGSISMMRSQNEETDESTDLWLINLLVSGYVAEPASETAVADPVRTEIDQDILEQLYRRAGQEMGNVVRESGTDLDSAPESDTGVEDGETSE
jgi:hypothetical protein